MDSEHRPSGEEFASEIVSRLSGRGEPYSRYELEGEIDRGGQGAILRVWDEDLRRTLAMKLLKPGLLDRPGALARFVEEAQCSAQLQHPGIVPIHDFGRDGDGRVWFTMREVRGRTLSEVIEDARNEVYRFLARDIVRELEVEF